MVFTYLANLGVLLYTLWEMIGLDHQLFRNKALCQFFQTVESQEYIYLSTIYSCFLTLKVLK